jgi:hypothetical protein
MISGCLGCSMERFRIPETGDGLKSGHEVSGIYASGCQELYQPRIAERAGDLDAVSSPRRRPTDSALRLVNVIT